jgi:hypothetical protein
MRLCCPFFLLVIHEAIRNHLAFRQSFYSSYVVEPESEERTTSQREQDLELLNKVHLQSVDVLLYNCRSQVEMFKVSLGSWAGLIVRICYRLESSNVRLLGSMFRDAGLMSSCVDHDSSPDSLWTVHGGGTNE